MIPSYLFIYLAALGVSCHTWDLCSLLWHVGALVATCGLLVTACGI